MITFNRVRKDLPFPAGEQLKARLRSAIRAGELRSGSTLPKVRDLAEETGVNPNTVCAAYRDLVREGLVRTHKRGGTRVAPGPFFAEPGDAEIRRTADRLIELARLHQWNTTDLLRLVVGRWPAETELLARSASRPQTFGSPDHAYD